MQTIYQACRAGDLAAVKQLLDADASLVDQDDEHRWRPVFHAAYRQHADIVCLLIGAGADLSAHNGDALHYASEVPGNEEIVELLVKYGAMDAHVQPTSELSRQLHAALFLGNEKRVASLLHRHSELAQSPDGRGDTPLHHAARCGNTEIVRLLLDAGADVHATNPRGHTVLYCAGGHGHHATVQLLLDRGTDADVRFTTDGMTLVEWLQQFPDDKKLQRVAQQLRSRKDKS